MGVVCAEAVARRWSSWVRWVGSGGVGVTLEAGASVDW